MGGNKVAVPRKAGGADAQGTGKIYSGKTAPQNNGGLTGGAGKRSGPSGIGGGGASGGGASSAEVK